MGHTDKVPAFTQLLSQRGELSVNTQINEQENKRLKIKLSEIAERGRQLVQEGSWGG